MIIIFKLIGGFVGMRLAMLFHSQPFAGLVIGGILGHSVDIVISTKVQRYKATKYWRAQADEQYQRLFLSTVFTMLGKLCAADGQINPAERAAVEQLIDRQLKLRRRERRQALMLFQNARRSPSSFQFDAAQYFEIHQRDPSSLENFLHIMFDVAMADGKLIDEEERLLRSAAMVFNIDERRYIEIRTAFLGGKPAGNFGGQHAGSNGNGNGNGASGDPYKVLGCSPNDSVAVIKQNYRKLVSDFHPDKIVSKNLPEEFTRFATEKFKAIQEAYESVKAEKKFN